MKIFRKFFWGGGTKIFSISSAKKMEIDIWTKKKESDTIGQWTSIKICCQEGEQITSSCNYRDSTQPAVCIGARNPLEQAIEVLLTVDWSRINPGLFGITVCTWARWFVFCVGQQFSIDFCTNNEKEPVGLLSSTSIRLFMVNRHLSSKMDMICTDQSSSLIES